MKRWAPYIILLTIILAFFYKTILFGKVPFPGDLLVSEYVPWRHASYLGYNAGAVPSKSQYFDVARELYPWKTLVIDQIKQFKVPLWNPYNFSGTPLLANYQSQVFYPLGILYFLLPQITAWTILMFLQPLLGSIFMYLFIKEIGLSKKAAILGSLLFNFSSFAIVWFEFNAVWHTILWLPLLLYLFEKFIKQKKLIGIQKILFIFALFSSITAGHPQDFINCFLFLLIYVLIRFITVPSLSTKEKISLGIYHLIPVIIIPFLLAAPQVISTIELYQLSARVPHDLPHILNSMLIQLWQLPMLISQDFFGNPATRTYTIPDTYVGKTLSIGTVGFLFALISVFQKEKKWHWRFFAITTALLLLISINSPLTTLLYKFPIPILATGTPTRNLFILMFALSVVASYGFDYLQKNNQIQKNVIFAASGIFTLLWISSFILPIFIPNALSLGPIMKRGSVFASIFIFLFILVYVSTRKYPKLTVCFILIAVFELFYGFQKFNPFVPKEFIYPKHDVLTFLEKNLGINRYWGYGTARMESNLNIQYKLYSTDGTDPLNLALYNRFIQSSKDGDIAQKFTRSTRSDAALAPGYGESDLPNNNYRLRIMDLLGIKYVLDRVENPKNDFTFSGDRFQPVFKTRDEYTIYENKKSLPRIFLADSIEQYGTDSEFEKIFFDPTFNIQKTILIENSTTPPKVETSTTKEINILLYEPTSIKIQTSSDAPQMLFISDAYAPGWKAKIDNTYTAIYKADYAFRAVFVPTGSHLITLQYRPDSFIKGVWTACITIFILFSYICFIVIRLLSSHKRKNK